MVLPSAKEQADKLEELIELLTAVCYLLASAVSPAQ
jgi:hypothetical protein